MSLEVAYFAFQKNSLLTKPVTLCSLIGPLGMRMKKEDKAGGGTKLKRKQLHNLQIKAENISVLEKMSLLSHPL